MKTKQFFSDRVKLLIMNDYPNIDDKIDEREIFLCLDATVNEMAKKNYFENWRLTGASLDEQFITTFEDVTVTDPANSLPSYLTFPANYVALPKNGGIVEVYPIAFKTEYQPLVVVISHEEYRRFLSNPAGNMQGRLTAYPEGNILKFTTCEVKKKFGNMNVRLAIRDSSQIADDAPYGIPADAENAVVMACVALYVSRRMQPTDSVRDNKDQA